MIFKEMHPRDPCFAAEAAAYLSKPLDLNNLIATLQTLLDSNA